ncbi:MAG: carbamoyltransferase HypF [Hydrogenothermaceae bacterium]
MPNRRVIIRLSGAVQGVGFRPFVYNLANKLGIKGYVLNDGKGVYIEAEGGEESLRDFIIRINLEKPLLSNIFSQEVEFSDNLKNFEDFQIIHSDEKGEKEAFILPDISVCDECLKELFDKNNRRYLYPFITCTNCGPRFSIIEALPYDRGNTTMKTFKMCPNCEKEYNDPTNRRFHAQPNGCSVCGPQIFLYTKDREYISGGFHSLNYIKKVILEGKIVAVKGIGGFHLVCDATNDDAVKTLRDRKKRLEKPFAVMFKDIDSIKKYADLTLYEEIGVLSSERPIVLVKRKEGTDLSKYVAPDIDRIGVFLPYSPIHHILLNLIDKPLVMTSANLSDEPIVKDNEEAFEKLSYFTDYILIHNRDIRNRVDDSVIFFIEDKRFFIRRSRGYAPLTLKLPYKLKKKVLTVGGHQKVVIGIGLEDKIFLSQHIGDLETVSSQQSFEEIIYTFFKLYDFFPEVVISDLHPRYYSTKWAKDLSEKHNIEHIKLQHHYAHGLSVMIDNLLENRDILSICWDGTGYGIDGNLWGGEFLITNYNFFERVLHFDYFKLLGGEKAVKEPRRVALSILIDMYKEKILSLDVPTLKAFSERELENLNKAYSQSINTPLSSSVGRLFDAVASILDIRQILSFEGQSGMIMERFYDNSIKDFYPFSIKGSIIDWREIFEGVIKDRENINLAVSRFINTLVEIIFKVANNYQLPVGISGGVFQNKILTQLIINRSPKEKIKLYTHRNVPPNDGGISLGQCGVIFEI